MTDCYNDAEMFAQTKKASYLCCIRRTSFETRFYNVRYLLSG
ncbi:hypothetical protein M075_0128 [Bacteroides fragilis str. 20793-3]|nr:hypothetical protein M075_0128 [Bacteroides fragilis str. 20793-3]